MSDVYNRVVEVHQVPRRSVLASISLAASVFVASMALTAAFGTRWDLFHFQSGFMLLRWCVYGGVVTGLLSLMAVWTTLPFRTNTRGFSLAVLAVTISALVVGVPLNWWMTMKRTPPIHDVTTDLQNPPKFNAIHYFRGQDANELNTTNPERANLQKQFYPGLDPIVIKGTKAECIKLSLQAARELDWTVLAANWEEGYIEATDETFWFGFKDDVAVRIAARDDRCEVNLRSVSRQGVGDAGTNARRIYRFIRTFKRNI